MSNYILVSLPALIVSAFAVLAVTAAAVPPASLKARVVRTKRLSSVRSQDTASR